MLTKLIGLKWFGVSDLGILGTSTISEYLGDGMIVSRSKKYLMAKAISRPIISQ